MQIRRLFLLLWLLMIISGCATADVEELPISGTVTYDGKPLKSGTITFEPTLSAGMIAKACYIPIKDGVYESGANGTTRGEFNVRVVGYDHSRMKNVENEDIPLLFSEYAFTVQLPCPDHRLDIDVPKRRR